MSPNNRSRGLTFVEVAIATGVLMFIMSIVYMVLLRASAHTATQTTVADLDSQCRIVMAAVTRDLREADDVQFDAGTFTMVGAPQAATAYSANIVATQIRLTKVLRANPLSKSSPSDDFDVTYDPAGQVTWSSQLLEAVYNGLDDDRDQLIDQCAIRRVDNTGTYNITTRGTSRSLAAAQWPAVPAGGAEMTMVPRWPEGMRPPAIYFAFSLSDPDGTAGPIPAEVSPLVNVVVTLQGVDSRGRPLLRSLTSKVSLRNSVRPPAP